MNSLNMLDNEVVVEKLVKFIKKNPFPTNDMLHSFAKSIGMEPDDLEEYAYAMLSVILTGGTSKGKPTNASQENKMIGYNIEKEHVETGIDHPVIKKIETVFKNKIKNDHLTETDTYYVDGVNFKNELKQEEV